VIRDPAPSVPCAHDICTTPAITRQHLPSGWANLCRKHYEQHHQAHANDFCSEHRLTTAEDKQAWIAARIGKVGKGIERIPGSDDE